MNYVAITCAALLALPALIGCSSRDPSPASSVPGSSSPNPSSPSLISGTIEALASDRSSLTVAGQRVRLAGLSASAGATPPSSGVLVNGKPANPNALGVGQRVTVRLSGGTVTQVSVSLELRGNVSSVDAAAGKLIAAGTVVSASSATRLDRAGGDDSAALGTGSLAGIKVGDFIEVTGTTDAATGTVYASKLEVKTASELDSSGQDGHTEFKGVVSGLAPGATTFTLNALTVNCTNPCQIPPSLNNGDVTLVEGQLASDGSLNAIRFPLEGTDNPVVDPPPVASPPVPGSSVILGDNVQTLNAATLSFTLSGYTVDYRGAAVLGGDLVNGVFVKVEGAVDASDAKLVRASRVVVEAGVAR